MKPYGMKSRRGKITNLAVTGSNVPTVTRGTGVTPPPVFDYDEDNDRLIVNLQDIDPNCPDWSFVVTRWVLGPGGGNDENGAARAIGDLNFDLRANSQAGVDAWVALSNADREGVAESLRLNTRLSADFESTTDGREAIAYPVNLRFTVAAVPPAGVGAQRRLVTFTGSQRTRRTFDDTVTMKMSMRVQYSHTTIGMSMRRTFLSFNA